MYGNKMKLKLQIYLKQKIYRTERKFIKLREEPKKSVSWHHNGDPFKDINHIFPLRAAFYGMHQLESHLFQQKSIILFCGKRLH